MTSRILAWATWRDGVTVNSDEQNCRGRNLGCESGKMIDFSFWPVCLRFLLDIQEETWKRHLDKKIWHLRKMLGLGIQIWKSRAYKYCSRPEKAMSSSKEKGSKGHSYIKNQKEEEDPATAPGKEFTVRHKEPKSVVFRKPSEWKCFMVEGVVSCAKCCS